MRHLEYQYLDLLKETLEAGVKQVDKGTGAVTWSVFGRQIRFDLSQEFPLLTTKKVYWNGVLHELYWFLSGQSNIKYLVDNNVHLWDDYPYKIYREKVLKGDLPELTKEAFIEKIQKDEDFAKQHGELRHIYGEMWRRWPATDGRSVDQIRWVINELKKDPDCHNALVTSWNPEFLYDMAKPGEALRFPICHNMFQFNVKNGRLSCQLYQRTADIFLGVPFNIASYSLLTLIIAHVTDYRPGEFIHTFGDLHIYENHKEQAEEQLTREPRPFPRVSIDPIIRDVDELRPEHVKLEGYNPHDTIKAPLTPTGGVATDDWKQYVQQ